VANITNPRRLHIAAAVAARVLIFTVILRLMEHRYWTDEHMQYRTGCYRTLKRHREQCLKPVDEREGTFPVIE